MPKFLPGEVKTAVRDPYDNEGIDMPEFLPGEVKTAVAPITVQPVGLVCDAELYLGPDETTKVATSGKISFVSTGLQQSVRLPVMMPAEAGIYHVYLNIRVGIVPLVAYQAIEDVVISMPLAGSLVGELIWHEGLAGWEEIVPGRGIPPNEEIHLAPMWINQSEINIIGHVDLSVTYPDGSQTALSAVLNQDREATPGNGKTVQFAPFLSTQEGTYTLEATLSSAGQVLDTYTFTLIVPLDGAEPGSPV